MSPFIYIMSKSSNQERSSDEGNKTFFTLEAMQQQFGRLEILLRDMNDWFNKYDRRLEGHDQAL